MVDLREGEVIDGRYRLLSKVGTGGMADVWLADDPHLGRRVALKVLHRRFAQDTEFVARFRREAEAAAGLQHPNVVSIFDRGQVGDTYYIAMEYLPGRNLADAIRGGLTITQSVAIVRQILEAARFAHGHGVVHRDLKPQNVILDDQGRAKVTDFGIARAGVSEITESGAVMGTAHYLPPEQAQGFETTPQSDLYSVGIILYECLTGRVPFEAESSVAVALMQVSEQPARPSSINPNVSPALDAVVMRAMAKRPEQRFTDAEAFIAALDDAEREPVAGPGQTAAYAPLPPTAVAVAEEPRRGRWWWWALGIAVIVGILLGILATREPTAEVPNVTNPFGTFLTLNEAREELQDAGFELEEVHRVERLVPRDTVLEQNPPPGEAAMDCAFLSLFCSKPGVTLTVSAGPGTADVPDVAGLEVPVAVRRLEAAGFQTEVERRHSTEVPQGIVIGTVPAAGRSERRGSTVTVIGSTGPRSVAVPALIGLTVDAAIARLQERGLGANVSEREDDAPRREVIQQTPQPGQRIEVGESVDLVVSSGVETVIMPSLVGTPRADAVSLLRELGLRPVVTERDVPEQAQANLILEQVPAAGAELERGEVVSLVAGRFVPAPEPPQPEPEAEGGT